MTAMERCGLLALGMAILLGAVVRVPWTTARLAITGAPQASIAAPVPELEALSSRLRSIADDLCLSASAIRLVDFTGCRERLVLAGQVTWLEVMAFMTAAENRR